jgi:hypothetical protein
VSRVGQDIPCAEACTILLTRKVKLLVTSRPNTPSGDEFWRQSVDPQSIQLMGENGPELETISAGIGLVPREKVNQFNQIRIIRGIEDDTRIALQQRLDIMRIRTYLWVALVFLELESNAGVSRSKLLRVVDTISATVEDAYERILAHTKDTAQTLKLLHIIVGAMRHLTLDEMKLRSPFTDLVPASKILTSTRELLFKGQYETFVVCL